MPKIYFSENPNVQLVQNFYDYVRKTEKSYDKDKIIEWVDSHLEQLGDKKAWLLNRSRLQEKLRRVGKMVT